MKKLGFLILSIIVLASCTPEHPKEYLSFSGTLENAKDSILYITGFNLRKKITINPDGTFKDSLKVAQPNLYTLQVPRTGKAYVHLANGYDLKLKGDGNDFFKSFRYEGKTEGAQSNNLIIDQFNLGQTAGNRTGFLILEKEPFLQKIAKFRKGMDSIAQLYPKANTGLVEQLNTQNEKFYKDMEDNYDRYHAAIVAQEKAKVRLAKGKPAPEFNDYENFAGGTTSLKDFRGKYVYIDVWATWCRPCLAQIPFLKQLEKDFKGKNIEFVSISTDDQRRSGGSWEKAHDKWAKMVKDKDLSGVQLWAGKDDYRFSTEYQITGIPRFILIDPDGNIVNSNEMRPSSPNISDYFTSLGVK